MCQITLVNLGNRVLNGIYLTTLLQINSVGNQDGTGFLSVTAEKKGKRQMSLWKTKDAADDIENLGILVKTHLTSSYPVIGHVRYASKGILPSDDNSHPFRGTRFYLAHNGRLYGKDETVAWQSSVTEEVSSESDSMKFLTSLEENAVLHPEMDIVGLLNLTMTLYKGKFAFAIYDCVAAKWYIARGFSADLHVVTLSNRVGDGEETDVVGFIINTRKDSLENAITLVNQTVQVVTGKYVIGGDIKELEKESVYEVTGTELVKIGELKEKLVSYAAANRSNTAWTNLSERSDSFWKLPDRINKFMEDHFLSISDIDALFFIFMGVGIWGVDEDDISAFIALVIPRVSSPRKTRERILRALGPKRVIYSALYAKIDMEYPWMAASPAKIDQLCAFLEDARKVMS